VFLQDLNCNISIPAFDADGDVLSYQYKWERVSVDFYSTLNNAQPEIVAAEEVDEPGIWSCMVTVTDEDGDAATSTTSAVYVEEPGESSDSASVSCEVIQDSGFIGNRTTYWLNPDDGTPFQTMCDFTADGGGWALAFTAPASDTTFGSAWDYWYSAGETVTLDTGVTGKSEAFDRYPFTEIRLTATEGGSEIRATAGAQANLIALIGAEPTTCAPIVGTGRHDFPSTFRTGTYFPNEYIAIVACDTDGNDLEHSTHYDLAVFSSNLNHTDYSASLGDIGSKDRLGGISSQTSSSSTNIVQIWVR
jgi:hypothetical protein